jgi:hypothetical protein
VSNNGLIAVMLVLASSLSATTAVAKPVDLVPLAPNASNASLEASACSFRRPVCVHGTTDLHALEAFEHAWEAGAVLGVPLPGSYDVYVRPEPSRTAIAERGTLASGDRARAFSVLDSRLSGCSLDFDAARELFAASAIDETPTLDDGTLRAETTALAHLAVPCRVLDDAVFQAYPERALVDRHVDADSSYIDGASVFFSWLDDSYGKQPGHLITSTWALAETHTSADAVEWNSEPDVFDVLRESMKDVVRPGSTLDDVLVEMAVTRAFDLENRPRLDWDVPWPVQPRTLASPEGVAETGTAFVRIDTRGHKAGTRFRMDASWEEHAKLRWVVLKLDAHDHVLARYDVVAAPKAIEAHLQVVDVDDASALLVVATNVGNWTAPFDPDDDVWEPHGWLLTIAAE